MKTLFQDWLERHPCSERELWLMQNMLRTVMEGELLSLEVEEAWRALVREQSTEKKVDYQNFKKVFSSLPDGDS